MSLNYYIHTKDNNMAFDLMPRVEIDKENREFVIHLCQTQISAWNLKPTFECHSYSTFKELKEILLGGKYIFTIEDEYGIEISPDEFVRNMELENANGKSRIRPDTQNHYTVDENGFEFIDCDFC